MRALLTVARSRLMSTVTAARAVRACVALLLAGVWALAAVPARAEAPAAATGGGAGADGVAEEISLASLGLGPLAVRGPRGSVSAFFPAPAAPEVAGSFVRVVAGSGPEVGPGSSLEVRVNGTPAGSAAISPASASDSVVEVAVPPDDLRADAPNLVEVRFALAPAAAGPAGPGLSAVLEPATLVHYQLSAPGEPADAIGLYPYPLLTAPTAGGPSFGLVLPPAADAGEVGTALRVISDVGRRGWSRQVVPVVATSDQASWLAGGHGPAVAVGRLDDLPGVAAGLAAAGSAEALAPDDGVIAQTSPTAPVIALTGRTDAAVAAAADALIAQPDAGLAGPVAVVRPRARLAHDPPRRVALDRLAPQDEAVAGPGEHRVALGFPVPPVDRSTTATVQIAVSATIPAGAPGATAQVEIGGQRIGGGALSQGADRTHVLDLRAPARLLRPGMDGLAVDVDIPALDNGAPAAARILWEGSALTLGPAPASAGGLESLPSPFLDAPRRPVATVVLAGPLPDAIGPAAAVMAALGARLASPPPDVVVATSGNNAATPRTSIVIGAPSVGGRPGGLELNFGAGGTVAVQAPPGPPSGWIRLIDLPAQGVNALWVGGVGAQATANASRALLAGGLTGAGVSVWLDGSTHAIPTPQVSMQPSPELRLTGLLPLLALLGLGIEVGVAALRLRRPGRAPR